MAVFTGKIISVGNPTEATTGQEICPAVVVGNTSTTVPCAVAVAWEGEESDIDSASFTIVGISGFTTQQTIYPNPRVMPTGSVSWKLNLLKINDDGMTWSKSGISKTINIANVSVVDDGTDDGGGGGIVPTLDDESFWDKYKWYIGGGAAIAALLAIGAALRHKR